MESGMIIGVGFLLFSKNELGEPCVFTVEELVGKPSISKEAGMISFPLETFQKQDMSEIGTIFRLLEEEVGVHPHFVDICKVSPEKFSLIPGRQDIVTVYGYGTLLGNPGRKFRPKDSDIRFAGWKTLNELLVCRIRVETTPIIRHFYVNHFKELLNQLSVAA